MIVFLQYYMSHFKIETILPSSTLEPRITKIATPPLFSVKTSTLSLLTYDVQSLLEIVSNFLKDGTDKQLTSKVLKILAVSLNDSKLLSGLESIFALNIGNENLVYKLLALWM
jgi:hypothetical protein